MEAQRLRCNCNSAYGSGAFDEGPVPKLAGRPLQLGLRVHHDSTTGSRSGFPETSGNRIPSSPAWTVTSSPLSKRTSERLPVRSRIRASLPSISFSIRIPKDRPNAHSGHVRKSSGRAEFVSSSPISRRAARAIGPTRARIGRFRAPASTTRPRSSPGIRSS